MNTQIITTVTVSAPQLVDLTDNASIADGLGEARARLAKLKTEIESMEELLKARRVGWAEGDKYRVTVSYDVEKKTTKWKAIAEQFEPSRQLIRAHTKYTTYDRVNVTALKKEV
mgnify:CR=1 FL=1